MTPAVYVLAKASSGRFVAAPRGTWPGGWVIALSAHVRRFPALETWTTIGAWLGAGNGGHPSQTWGVAWAASNALIDAAAKATAWRATTAAEPLDDWEAAKMRYEREQAEMRAARVAARAAAGGGAA
jgi:hypothetical protein